VGDLVFFKLGPRRGCVRATSAIEHYERGLALESGVSGRPPDIHGAMSAYRRALSARPDMADAYNNLGRLHHDLADLSPASGASLGSGSSASDASRPASDRTRLVADAEGLYRLAICADAGVALYWFNLGVALEDQGRCAEAITAYERSLALDPHFADAHFNLARQLEVAGTRGPLCDELVLRRAVRHLKRYRDLVRAG
jgi:tetratricopeptide (TPR) repeat protein